MSRTYDTVRFNEPYRGKSARPDRRCMCDRSGNTSRARGRSGLTGSGGEGTTAHAGSRQAISRLRFVEALRQRNIVPHVAEYERGNLQRNSLREEERNSAGFQQSQRKRKLV